MPVNQVVLQELNQLRTQDAGFRFTRNFWFLVLSPISEEMPVSLLLLLNPMKVWKYPPHRISSKNKMSLKEFQVIWQPYH